MFRAALVSRSCSTKHSEQAQCLIPSAPIPFGLLADMRPQLEHVWEVHRSETSRNTARLLATLYRSISLNVDQPASKTDFAILVLVSLIAFTSPTTISELASASLVLATCKW